MSHQLRCFKCGRFTSERVARWFDYEWYCSDDCERPARVTMAFDLARRHRAAVYASPHRGTTRT